MNEGDLSWRHRGGIVDGKIEFIRQVMEKYQVDKPLFHTEGALMCAEYNTADCEEPDELFFDAQAEYAIRVYVGNWANGIEGTIWYQFEGPGWRYSGLLDDEQNPKPAYDALQFLSSLLSDKSYTGEITVFEGLRAYEFVSPEKQVWVLWSHEQVDTHILLPENVSAVYDKFGNEITPEGNQLVVNSPIFLEFLP
jgi:hypothetical protein